MSCSRWSRPLSSARRRRKSSKSSRNLGKDGDKKRVCINALGYLKTLDGEEYQLKGMTPIECFRCGICCQRYRPKLTLDEAAGIAQKLGMYTERFLAEYVQKDSRRGEPLLKGSSSGCVFLCRDQDGQARYDIYPFRPKACRNFIASLSRPECREGLSRLKSDQGLLLPSQLYRSSKAVDRLSKAVRQSDR